MNDAATSKNDATTATKKPSHTAYIVIDPMPGSDKKAKWFEIGAILPHKTGGFDLVIPGSICVGGRIVCIERDKQPAE